MSVTVTLNSGFYEEPFSVPLTLDEVDVNFFGDAPYAFGNFVFPYLFGTVPIENQTPIADQDAFGLTYNTGFESLEFVAVQATFRGDDFPAPLSQQDALDPSLVNAWLFAAADQEVTELNLSSNISDRPYAITINFDGNGPTVREIVEGWSEDDLRALNPVVNEGSTSPPWDWVGTADADEHVISYPPSGPQQGTAEGRGGDDTITGGYGSDTIYGNFGHDTLSADVVPQTIFGDTMYGGFGRDTITGSNAADDLYGGRSNDRMFGNDGGDGMRGGNGNDRMFGNQGTDVMYGQGGRDFLFGGNDVDGMWGGFGNDLMRGGNGGDLLWGQANNDTLYGDNGFDRLYGNFGNDTLYGGNQADRLFGGLLNDRLFGGNGNDFLNGGSGFDRLFGGNGNDSMNGSAGRDVLIDGRGTDTLVGGAGVDRFVFNANTSSGDDVIEADLDDTILLRNFQDTELDIQSLGIAGPFTVAIDDRVFSLSLDAPGIAPSVEDVRALFEFI